MRRLVNTWPQAALTARAEARYWLRIAISAYTPPAFDVLVRGFLSEYRHAVWYEKTTLCLKNRTTMNNTT